MIIGYVRMHLNALKKKKNWRKSNKNNSTTAANNFDHSCVEVGDYSYGSLYVLSENKENKLKIGRFCSIAGGVKFILSSEHYTNHLSTYPFKVKICGADREAGSKGDIIIDDDVWIATNATILSGVHIGQGAIIAAGAVVTKDVPPYAMVGGVPARILKYRFTSSIINKLIKIDYSRLTPNLIKEHIGNLYEEITDDTDLSWLPQKEDLQ